MKFNILFITQDDPFYVKLFFDEFFTTYGKPEEIKGVVIAQPMGKKSLLDLAGQMYDFYGPVDFFRMGVRYVVHKAAGSLPRCISGGRYQTLAAICEEHEIPVVFESGINEASFLGKLREQDLDLIISVAAPVIFKEDIISIPTFGCINIHNGRLPNYRGMLPNFWQMYHGEKSIGITIHEINTGIDEGRIILQKDADIIKDESLESLIKRTKRVGAQFMIEAIDRIKSGNVTYLENPSSEGSYFSFPTNEDVREFKRRGYRIM